MALMGGNAVYHLNSLGSYSAPPAAIVEASTGKKSQSRVPQRAVGIAIKTFVKFTLLVGLMKSSSPSLLGFGAGEGEVR